MAPGNRDGRYYYVRLARWQRPGGRSEILRDQLRARRHCACGPEVMSRAATDWLEHTTLSSDAVCALLMTTSL